MPGKEVMILLANNETKGKWKRREEKIEQGLI